MGEALSRIVEAAPGSIRLVSFQAGEKRNAIPSEAEAVLALPRGAALALHEALDCAIESACADVARACGGDDSGAHLSAERLGERDAKAAAWDDTLRALRLLCSLPQGVHAMSQKFPGATETSNNVSIVRIDESGLEAVVTIRTNRSHGEEPIAGKIRTACEHAGASLEIEQSHKPWLCDSAAPFISEACEVYRDMFGENPAITTTHGGLECGVFSEALPGLEVFSLGPCIENAHTPSERMKLTSFKRLCAFVWVFVASCH